MVYTGFIRQFEDSDNHVSKAIVIAKFFTFHQMIQVWKARDDIGTMRADLGA
jgi:hypothetical protein